MRPGLTLLLLLLTPPLVVGQQLTVPSDVTIHEAAILRVLCNVTDVPDAHHVDITWTKTGDDDFKIDDPVLLVEFVSPSDAGLYVCSAVIYQVQGQPSWTDEGQTEVFVEYQPRWQPYSVSKYTGRPGSPASLYCYVKAWPAVQFSWDAVSSDVIHRTQQHDYSSRYDLDKVTDDDYGDYVCHATNTAGKAAFTVTLLPPGRPDSPFICGMMNVSGTEARLSCTPGYSGGEQVTFPVYQSLPYEENKRMPSREQLTENEVIITVGELRPNTSYTLLVYCSNVHGRSEDSVAVYVTTTDGVFIPWGEVEPVESGLPLYIIIVAAVAGTVGLLLLILLVVLLCKKCRRSPKPTTSSTSSKTGLRNQTFSASNPSMADHDVNPQTPSALHSLPESSPDYMDEWGAPGRGAVTPRALSHPSHPAHPAHPSHPSHPSHPNSIQLSGIIPGGESTDHYGEEPNAGFDNIAYCPESLQAETVLDRQLLPADRQYQTAGGYQKPDRQYQQGAGNQKPDRQYQPGYQKSDRQYQAAGGDQPETIAVHPDSYMAAQAVSKRQSGIAGMGALSGLTYQDSILNHQPRSSLHQLNDQPTATRSSLHELNNQPILKPLNISHPQHDSLNDLNQPGPQTVPIRTNLNVHPSRNVNPSRNVSPYSLPEELYEFPREQLNLRQRIGDGLYGEVWRARAEGIMGRKGQTVVAVKMLKDDYTSEERRAILRELKTMKSLQPHPNVVALLGCCTLTDPLYIIMEYAGKGSLQFVLRSYRLPWSDKPEERYLPYANLPPVKRLTTRDLIGFAANITAGMEYISSREFLHRDLAARNILVDEKYVCKVSDFGNSRDIAQSRQYESRTQNRLPIRWMSPESLYDCMYSVKSDVWSFGVLLWEIVTLGSSPYPGMSGADVMELVKRGYRMDKPQLCSDGLYSMMRECWRHDPRKRPTFSELLHNLDAILQLGPEIDLEVAHMAENFYEILENLPGEKC